MHCSIRMLLLDRVKKKQKLTKQTNGQISTLQKRDASICQRSLYYRQTRPDSFNFDLRVLTNGGSSFPKLNYNIVNASKRLTSVENNRESGAATLIISLLPNSTAGKTEKFQDGSPPSRNVCARRDLSLLNELV